MHAGVRRFMFLAESKGFFPTMVPQDRRKGFAHGIARAEDGIARKRSIDSSIQTDVGLNQIGVDLSKKCKFTKSPGELRLKLDMAEVKEKLTDTSGHVVLIPNPSNPLRFFMKIFVVGWNVDAPVTELTFDCKTSRRYPNFPPTIFLAPGSKFKFSAASAVTIRDSDGALAMPILEPSNWSPVYTIYDVVVNLAAALHTVRGVAGNDEEVMDTADVVEVSEGHPPLFFGKDVDVSHIPPLPACTLGQRVEGC